MDNRKLLHVVSELDSYTGVKKKVGDSTFISCPYHSERTPSFRIFHSTHSKSPGFGKCYGCGASAKWDELAPKLGLKPYTYAKPTQQFARPVVRALESEDEHIAYHHKPLPRDKIWRTIRTNLLTEIGCSLISQYDTNFIYMPVMIRGEEKGYVRARLKKEKDKPSYLNKAGGWTSSYGLFPYDYSCRDNPKTIVLVEGPRDALRLVSNDIPAIAILGTQSWTKRKSHNLEITGADNIVLAFDGDCAGKAAEELVLPSLKPLMNVITFNLRGKDSPYWEFRREEEPSKAAKAKGVQLWDPGNMPLSKLRELKALVRDLDTASG